MNRVGKISFPAWPWLCAALLLTAVAIPLGRWAGKARLAAAAAPNLDDWDIPRLILHLKGQGLALRPVASACGLAIDRNVFFTRTDLDFEQLNLLPKVPERIEGWRGTVFCERIEQVESREIQMDLWGDCCLFAGPFVFFGNPELLAEINGCLYRLDCPTVPLAHSVAE